MANPVDIEAGEAICAKASEGPWERDTANPNSERECYNVITGANGKTICDSLNAETLCLSYESDGGGGGDWIDAGTLHDFEFIAAARTGWPAALAELRAAREENGRLRRALAQVNEIRNSIIGLQTVNWSAHIYPLVAALNGAGFQGKDYEAARDAALKGTP